MTLKPDFDRTEWCTCDKCRLGGSRKVFGEGPTFPKVAFLGEAPGAEEDKTGRPFMGGSGYELNLCLAKAGLSRAEIYIFNTILCRPPKNDISSIDGMNALNNCRNGFFKEIEWLREKGVKILVPMGNTALGLLDITDRIGKARGSTYFWNGFVVIPTYHPAFILRVRKEEVTFVNDLKKVADAIQNPPRQLKENFNIFPTIEEIEEFTERVLKKGLLVAVDIETTGLDPYTGEIVVVGMATSEEDAISFPKYCKGKYEYWHNGNRIRAVECLRKILAEGRTMFQNAMYDVYWLTVKGFEVNHIEHDILLLHHCMHAELPHNLEYITSVYGQTSAWKSEYGKHGVSIFDKEDSLVRTYNCRDVVVLHQILLRLREDCKKAGTYSIYRNISMHLIHPLIEMQMNGLKVDQKRLKNWKGELMLEMGQLQNSMSSLFDLPENFSFTSNHQMQALLYGVFPKKLKEDQAEFADYETNGKRTDTKKYAALKEKVETFASISPFLQPTGLQIKKTDGGSYSVDEEAILKFKLAIRKRLLVVENLRTIQEKHIAEEATLRRQMQFFNLLLRFRELEKLRSTYTTYEVDSTGTLHYSFKIHGTRTGRLSCGG